MFSMVVALSGVSASASEGKVPYSSLTPEEREILERGEVDSGQYVVGGVVGTFVGLGIGQAIQGRYIPTGLIFTIGEMASIGLIVAGIADCTAQSTENLFTHQTHHCSTVATAIGVFGLLGFRIGEMVDLWATPPSINRRYRNLEKRVEGEPEVSVIPAFSRDLAVDGAALAVQFRF